EIEDDIKNVLQNHSIRAKEKNIAINHSFHYPKTKGEIPFVVVDKLRFLHSIENIIENAIDYTLPGGRIDFLMEVTKNDLFITISDTGIGIGEKDKNNIFSEFFRSHKARELKSVGSGIGLFLIKLIIEAHDGKVWFDSIENKGTNFYVKVPLRQKPVKPNEKLEVFLKNI
ncbi:MAG: HAMP domain-containing sensor histidine kinase, partial [Patescibacteria group bacterium]